MTNDTTSWRHVWINTYVQEDIQTALCRSRECTEVAGCKRIKRRLVRNQFLLIGLNSKTKVHRKIGFHDVVFIGVCRRTIVRNDERYIRTIGCGSKPDNRCQATSLVRPLCMKGCTDHVGIGSIEPRKCT